MSALQHPVQRDTMSRLRGRETDRGVDRFEPSTGEPVSHIPSTGLEDRSLLRVVPCRILVSGEGEMASAVLPHDRRAARIATVERHVELENAHALDGVLGTFGNNAHYDDEAWGDHYTGRDGVRAFYEQLMKALPDLEIEILKRHVAEENIVLEVMIRGTQMGTWRGLPGTGRRVELPLCGVYTFDEDDRLAGERIYY